jgi:hypothetical protein
VITVELPTGVIEQGTFEIALPDRSHFTITVGAMVNETIVIGNERYAKMGQTWMRLPPPPPQGGLPRVLTTTGGLNQLDAFIKAAQAGALNRGGTGTVNNRSCQLYSHSLDTNNFEYCVFENLPLRMKVSSPSAIITFLFTDFDQNVVIAPPN